MKLIMLLGATLFFSLDSWSAVGAATKETSHVEMEPKIEAGTAEEEASNTNATGIEQDQSDKSSDKYFTHEDKRYRFDYEFNEQAGGWLKLHEVPATWQEARLRCHSEGAILASPVTGQLKDAIVVYAWEKKFSTHKTSTEPSSYVLFTGVHSTFSKGDYSSVEGVPLSRLSVTWAEGQPDNFNNSESCLVMDAGFSGMMADERCDDVHPYVCYKKEKKLKIENECGTTDPEYKLEASTGSCYKMHETKRSWARAYQTCAGEGAHLAIVNSEQEADVLSSLIKRSGSLNTFIGFHDWGSYGREWMTIHGETLLEAGYARWGSGEPNNLTYASIGDMGEFCGGMIRYLNDMPCHYPSPFICERLPGATLEGATGPFEQNKPLLSNHY